VSSISAAMRLLQFGDSMLPVGSFSFSNGLESAVQQKVVHDLETLRQFVLTAVRQAGTSDGIAVLEAFRAAGDGDADRITRADRAVFNRKLNEEMRTMSVRMGRKLAEMAEKVAPSPKVAA
jgi:urease accessory protein